MKQADDLYVMIPERMLRQLAQDVQDIKQALTSTQRPIASEYVSEAEAASIVGKKTSWLWQQRVKGVLPYHKVGRKVFYRKTDIDQLLNLHRIPAFK